MKKIIPFLFCLVATCNAELRTWTAVNGKEVEAELVSNSDGQVTLKLKSGKVFRVPLNKLSKSDQEFLNLKIVMDDQKPPTVDELLAAMGTPLNKFEKIIADKKYLEKSVVNTADQNSHDGFERCETINRTNRTYSILNSVDGEKYLVHGIWMIKGNNLYWMELVLDGIKIPNEDLEVLKAKIITLDKEKSFFSLPPIEEEDVKEEQITWELIEEFTSVEMQKFNDEVTNKNFNIFEGQPVGKWVAKVMGAKALFTFPEIDMEKWSWYNKETFADALEYEWAVKFVDPEFGYSFGPSLFKFSDAKGPVKGSLSELIGVCQHDLWKLSEDGGENIGSYGKTKVTDNKVHLMVTNKTLIDYLLESKPVHVEMMITTPTFNLNEKVAVDYVSPTESKEREQEATEEVKPEEPDISIHKAAKDGNIDAIKKHLESGTNVNEKDHSGKLPLYHAVWNDRTEIAKLLISKGASVNTEKSALFNPLYSAAGGNAGKETIELLITNGADLNFIRERGGNKGDETPLDRATRKGRTEIAELLRTHGAKTSKELKAEAE